MNDFVEFLESNFSYTTTDDVEEDSELRILLQTGSVAEVGDAMDETELVVQQLETKRQKSMDELFQLQAEKAAGGNSYSAQLQLQERIDAVEAQQKVVDGYITKAKKRLLKLQSRYKDLIVYGKQDDRRARSNWDEIRKEAATQPPPPSQSPSSSPSSSQSASWKSEGFGSYGRGSRGSSRRRRRQGATSASSSSSTYSSRPEPPPRRPPNSRPRATTSTAPQSPPSSSPSVTSYSTTPPHRRPGRSYAQKLEDERRLREIKVDEEFDKLKKELGL